MKPLFLSEVGSDTSTLTCCKPLGRNAEPRSQLHDRRDQQLSGERERKRERVYTQVGEEVWRRTHRGEDRLPLEKGTHIPFIPKFVCEKERNKRIRSKPMNTHKPLSTLIHTWINGIIASFIAAVSESTVAHTSSHTASTEA